MSAIHAGPSGLNCFVSDSPLVRIGVLVISTKAPVPRLCRKNAGRSPFALANGRYFDRKGGRQSFIHDLQFTVYIVLYFATRTSQISQALPLPPPGFDSLSVDEQIDYVQSLWDHRRSTGRCSGTRLASRNIDGTTRSPSCE
ncbi:MAG: hypothetical protein QOH71_4267 [Blastocatellia bacterium]|nr:hypothetical protein [Blastocatellia bacterium]